MKVLLVFLMCVAIGCGGVQPIPPQPIPVECQGPPAPVFYGKPGIQFVTTFTPAVVGIILDAVPHGDLAQTKKIICEGATEAQRMAEADNLSGALAHLAMIIGKYVHLSNSVVGLLMAIQDLPTIQPGAKVNPCDKKAVIEICKRAKMMAC